MTVERVLFVAYAGGDVTSLKDATTADLEGALSVLRLDREAQEAALLSSVRGCADAAERFLAAKPAWGGGVRQ